MILAARKRNESKNLSIATETVENPKCERNYSNPVTEWQVHVQVRQSSRPWKQNGMRYIYVSGLFEYILFDGQQCHQLTKQHGYFLNATVDPTIELCILPPIDRWRALHVPAHAPPIARNRKKVVRSHHEKHPLVSNGYKTSPQIRPTKGPRATVLDTHVRSQTKTILQ